jgi:glucose/arabinose dehydrogenase
MRFRGKKKTAALAAAAILLAAGIAAGLRLRAYFSEVNLPAAVLLSVFGLGAGGQARASLETVAGVLQTPAGFRVGVFADNLPRARQIAIGEFGWVFVGSRGGEVFAVRDADGDGVSDERRIIADGLNTPHGVAYFGGDLYIGEIHRISVVRDILQNPNAPRAIAGGDNEIIISNLPASGHHGLRHLGVGPDQKLYIALGVPCNICKPEDAAMMGVIRRYELNGGGGEIFAEGIRNSVGFDWNPQSGALWFTDNGRDWLGDDLPHDELNRAPRAGMHFGYPFCHHGDLPDPEFGGEHSCAEFAPPALKTGAHVANLGMTFYDDAEMFPKEYRGAIFIALHGSWNRSVKVGYEVAIAYPGDNGVVADYAPFVQGWLSKGGAVSGRPVDVAVAADGALLISDDFSGALWRVSYEGAR